MAYVLDQSDWKLISALRRDGRASITELAKQTSLARSTIQLRLSRLDAQGVITGYGPDLAPARAGYGVTAYTTLSIVQGSHDRVVTNLEAIAEVLEVHVVTGEGDLLCRIAAKSNDHLHELLQSIVAMPEVGRADSQLALSSPVIRTIADLGAVQQDPK
nr:putative Lrp/AsnC family transcriptional regulator [uncultured bacterium]